MTGAVLFAALAVCIYIAFGMMFVVLGLIEALVHDEPVTLRGMLRNLLFWPADTLW